nr:hypothetical protein [Microbacterium sp. NIBRBAC000506063]
MWARPAAAADLAAGAATSAAAASAATAVVVLRGFFCSACGLFGFLAPALLLRLAAGLLAALALGDALLVGGDRLRSVVLERGELRFERAQVRGLLVEGRLGRLGRPLRLDKLLFGDPLQAVAFVAGDGGLIAELLAELRAATAVS